MRSDPAATPNMQNTPQLSQPRPKRHALHPNVGKRVRISEDAQANPGSEGKITAVEERLEGNQYTITIDGKSPLIVVPNTTCGCGFLQCNILCK